MPYAFAKELSRFGPGRPQRRMSMAEARGYCRHVALTHYENFTVASLLLPRKLLRHVHNIYAYCRWADDLADETVGWVARPDAKPLATLRRSVDATRGPTLLRSVANGLDSGRATHRAEHPTELLAWWRGELLECYNGSPHHPVMVALQETIQEFDIPPQPFLDLLAAFEQDQRVKEYQTFDQLLDYCRYSANPVGHLVLYVCRSYDQERAAWGDSICTGLQLANFWQDVSRDLDLGRIYLPKEDRERFGYTDADLRARSYLPEFRALMQFEVERARDWLRRGTPLVERMPKDVRPDIDLFVQGGLAILREIERCKYNVWRKRPTVGKVAKARLLLRSTFRSRTLYGCGRRDASGAAPIKSAATGQRLRDASGAAPIKSAATGQRLRRSYDYCTRLAQTHAGNFYLSFRILPRRQQDAMCALYAFMRVADDIADGPDPADEKQRRLNEWRRGLEQALGGQFSHPIHPALHDAVHRFRISSECLFALIDGVGQDVTRSRYANFRDLYDYCYRVASVVGLACIRIWGCRADRAGQFAEWCGIAFQLTNILRDVTADAAQGRVYLPQEELASFGCTEEQLQRGPCDERYRRLMQFQVQRARGYYELAKPLANYLPAAGRAIFLVMTRTYRGLLDAIERQGFDVVNGPVQLSKWQKWRHLLAAMPARLGWI